MSRKSVASVRFVVALFIGWAIVGPPSGPVPTLRGDEAAADHSAHGSSAEQADQPVLPFPHNRVRDFYAEQARYFLSQPRPWPERFPEFPGLDGGSFGHWGQNPEEDNFDATLNRVDVGGLLAQVTRHFGRTTFKAVNFRFGPEGEYTALFDPESLRYADAWQSGFVRWHATRFGITSGVDATGEPLAGFHDAGWQLPDGVTKRYRGFFRNGSHVVFHYRIGDASVYDWLHVENGRIKRTLSVDGALPDGARLGAGLDGGIDDGQTKRVALGAAPRWSGSIVSTRGELGDDTDAFAIDTLTVPYGTANPFRTPMRLGGLDFLPDGRIAVTTLVGDVWLVDGVDDRLEHLRWRRFAAGLNQPLGIVVQQGKILVLGRDQLTRLHDLNGDDEADFYECLTHEFPTAGGDGFATSLHQDAKGTLYWFTYSNDFGVTRFDPASNSPPTSIATGLRGTNGLAVSADGRIVLATAQEGTWTPATAIFEVGDGSYHGLMGPRPGHEPYGYDLPLCFVPRGVDNSPGEMAMLPNDPRLGPLAGHTVGTSFGYCQHYLILREPPPHHQSEPEGAHPPPRERSEREGAHPPPRERSEWGGARGGATGGASGAAPRRPRRRLQGGVVPLPGEFLSGAHRIRFNPRDGGLYVVGTDGWQSYARAHGSLQRLRYTGNPLVLPRRVETRANGLLVHFDQAIDPASVRTETVFCQQWNYLYSAAYGSPEYSVRQPGQRGHDRVDVRSVHVLPGGCAVFFEIPTLHPVMQLHLYAEPTTLDGAPVQLDLYYSIYELGEPFTEYPGYEPSEMARANFPPFPTATSFPRDGRLVRQEELGKDFSTLQGVVSRQVDAVGGLRFEPQVLRVPPGRRVALVVRNLDTGMPHNWVLVEPQRLDAVGTEAMRLAADPQAYATHYVPHDDGVLALSPILNPRDQYTVYFDSPRRRGAYPFVCTFPGHWQVMRGVLFVLDDDEPLPDERPFVVERKFVRDWKLSDLSDDLGSIAGRSIESGHRVFHIAGCAQCHTVGGHGATTGPDLTRVHERYSGAKLLQQILEPSSEINPAFQTTIIQRSDGSVVSGLVVAEDERQVSVLPNPLRPDQVTRIARDEIEQRSVSPVSTMPDGLLMTLTRDEILDLLAYLSQP